MNKILFLHGFYASGQCVPAVALREAFEGRAVVLTPDLPLHPKEALAFIRDLCDRKKPDVIVGNSCGSFYAQMIAPVIGIPALLGNPHFKMTEFLKPRIGAQRYKSPRANGNQDFIIDDALINEFAELEAQQFQYYTPESKERISDSCYYTQLLDIRRVLVAILYLKLSLSGCLYLSKLALACFGKLFGSLLCILDSLGHHLGLHLLE